MSEIKIGDLVTWTSQARIKTGRVIAIIEPGEDAMNYFPFGLLNSRKYFKNVSQNRRALVEVPRGNKSNYYAPRLSALRLKKEMATNAK